MHLHTYLLALAITGSVKRSGAPAEETLGSEPTQFVAAPWDTLEEYYFRAVRSAAAIPEASRLAWLERTDVAERAVWVSTFRDGEATIGEVIKHTMDRRGSHRDPPANLDARRTERGGAIGAPGKHKDWLCSGCGDDNLGRNTHCRKCGTPSSGTGNGCAQKKKISQRCKLNPKRRHHRIDPSRLQDQFQQH